MAEKRRKGLRRKLLVTGQSKAQTENEGQAKRRHAVEQGLLHTQEILR